MVCSLTRHLRLVAPAHAQPGAGRVGAAPAVHGRLGGLPGRRARDHDGEPGACCIVVGGSPTSQAAAEHQREQRPQRLRRPRVGLRHESILFRVNPRGVTFGKCARGAMARCCPPAPASTPTRHRPSGDRRMFNGVTLRHSRTTDFEGTLMNLIAKLMARTARNDRGAAIARHQPCRGPARHHPGRRGDTGRRRLVIAGRQSVNKVEQFGRFGHCSMAAKWDTLGAPDPSASGRCPCFDRCSAAAPSARHVAGALLVVGISTAPAWAQQQRQGPPDPSIPANDSARGLVYDGFKVGTGRCKGLFELKNVPGRVHPRPRRGLRRHRCPAVRRAARPPSPPRRCSVVCDGDGQSRQPGAGAVRPRLRQRRPVQPVPRLDPHLDRRCRRHLQRQRGADRRRAAHPVRDRQRLQHRRHRRRHRQQCAWPTSATP